MKRIAVLVVCVGLCLAVGALGGWVTAGSVKDWYPTLHKPSFNPPNWLFGPVWTVLYAMMGVAAWRVLGDPEEAAELDQGRNSATGRRLESVLSHPAETQRTQAGLVGDT